MLQFASSDSAAESEISKAESMSRKNHEMRWNAVGMLQAGARQSAVARELNVHRSVTHRLWNHYQRDQNASRSRGSGRRRITTTADDRYLLQCARSRRTLTASQRASQLSAAAGRPISRQTVSRRLHEGGLFARRPVVCVPLSPAHVRARLHWAREFSSWTTEQWAHVLFTGIATNCRTDLYVFAGSSVTAVRYRDEILHPLVPPFIAAIGTDAIFMEDNALSYRERLVRSYFESETIPQMACPAR
ncbi:hypothetical protein AVEN_64810-1 [Araneus ventricosus]|uniref:Transposase Tc1-like domain-containing protein n=1 Tax=Araneus ventricosus TaxID=182803 RepID=A0A4Y2GKJ7_ARAVE|nr:hypothetical protein AVEN_64810-1 [Araneus ventricosus]